MKIAAIKRLNERLPYWVKKPFSSVIRRRLIENRVFLDQYDALIRADAMTDASGADAAAQTDATARLRPYRLLQKPV